MSHTLARTKFTEALKTYTKTHTPVIPVAVDNVDFKLAEKQVYPRIKTHLIPADTFSDTLYGEHEGSIGIYQMTVITHKDKGDGAHEKIAADLKKVFRVNKLFTVTGDEKNWVQVVSPLKVNEGRLDGAEWVTVYYFEYRSDVNIDEI